MSNPFKTPEFKALFAHWNQVLEANGHQEIEDFSLPDAPLKAWHNHRWKNCHPDHIPEIQKYYEAANELLKTYVFKSECHRRVWELHCEGLSVRKIAMKLRQKKLKKTAVHAIIVTIESTSGLRHG